MALGIEKGARVNILAQTSIYWSQFDMAVLGAGAITVPIYPTNTPEDTKFIINHSEAVLLFVDDYKNLQKVAAIAKDCPKLKQVIVNFEVRASDVNAPFEIIQWTALYDSGLNQEKSLAARFDGNLTEAKPSDIFTICYTSGTTGLPKGVVLTHSCMGSVFEDVEKVIGPYVTDQEQLLSFLPMSHISVSYTHLTLPTKA